MLKSREALRLARHGVARNRLVLINGAGMFTIEVADKASDFDDAQLAAVAFLARYNDRTLDLYDPTSSCTGITWNNPPWRRRR